MAVTLLARQPIFDGNIEVVGYELLFRGERTEPAGQPLGDHATCEVICNAFSAAAEAAIFRGQAWINFTDGLIRQGAPKLLPSDRVVVEVLENVVVDEELLASLRGLREAGYTISLDDFVPSPATEPLIDVADIVKLDVMALSKEDLHRHVGHLEGRVQLLAEKVESREEFEACRELGFSLYQGFFLGRPARVDGERVRAQRAGVLRLLSEIDGADLAWIRRFFERDPALTYKLLRMVNSVAHSPADPVSAVERAVLLLGTKRIKRFLRLLALASMRDTHHELLRTCLVRAQMCEVLAWLTGKRDGEPYYLAGMLSVIDAMLGRPIPDLLERIALSDEIKNALLTREGSIGAAIECATQCEEGGHPAFESLSSEDVQRCWFRAVSYADGIVGGLV